MSRAERRRTLRRLTRSALFVSTVNRRKGLWLPAIGELRVEQCYARSDVLERQREVMETWGTFLGEQIA